MMPLKEWTKTVDWDAPDEKLATQDFFRDPIRPMIQDDEYFFSPADGIILYAEEVDGSDSKLFDVKGKAYRVQDLCQTILDGPMIVIGIFMAKVDVHVNRIPYSGYLRYKRLPCIKTRNLPMLDEENDLVKGKINRDDFGYLFDNERVLNSIVAPRLDLTYRVVQIADFDVNTITPFNTAQNVPVRQNDRFSTIRWGSQVDLVVPILPKFEYQILAQKNYHVEGSIDRLIRVTKRKNPPQRKNDPFAVLRLKGDIDENDREVT